MSTIESPCHELRTANGFHLCILVSVGGKRSQRAGPSPTLGSLGPSRQRRHKSRVSLRDPLCPHGVSSIPHGEVRDKILVKYSRSMKDPLKEIPKLLPPSGTPDRCTIRQMHSPNMTRVFMRLQEHRLLTPRRGSSPISGPASHSKHGTASKKHCTI